MSSDTKANPRETKVRKTKETENPKVSPDTIDNQIKDPEDWVTGHEPMTGAQASYLKTLSEQAHEPDAYDPKLDKAEASKRIDHLRQERRN
ncbi:MAG: DUF3072 domain-containing protein [Microvirga sp.]